MFCQSCLSTDRTMIQIDKIKSVMAECKLDQVLKSGSICWECHGIVIKLTEFHRQIAMAQTVLKMNKNEANNIKPLSRLTYHKCLITKFLYDDKDNTEDIKSETHSNTYLENETLDCADSEIKVEEPECDTKEAMFIVKAEPVEPKCELSNISDVTDLDSCQTNVSHVEKRKETVKFKCKKCNTNFRYFKSYKNHTNKHGNFICGECGEKFVLKSVLERHMISQHSEAVKKLWYCVMCEKQLKNEKNWFNHIKNSKRHIAINDTALLSCPDCDKKFTVQSSLNAHFKYFHLQVSKYKCVLCDKIFQSQYKLTNHNQVHHNEERTRNHPCSYCGKKYYTNHDRETHELLHSSDRSYMCTECGATYKQRSGLHNHMRITHGARSGPKT